VSVDNTTEFARDADATMLDIGLGGTFGVTETSYFYGTVSAAQSISGGSDATDVRASLGFNLSW
jgi:outer membrane autotransporter protein